MTRKQIDAAREGRLWLGQVVLPAITTGVALCSNERVRDSAARFGKSCKKYIGNMFSKEGDLK